MSEKAFEEWAILELMGHRRLAGLVKEQTIGSASFIRIDVFTAGDKAIATQFYNPSAVYCMTPTTEDLARRIAEKERPEPVTKWELPTPPENPAPSENQNINRFREEDGFALSRYDDEEDEEEI